MHQAFARPAPTHEPEIRAALAVRTDLLRREPPSRYGERRVRWRTLAAVAIAHAFLLVALVKLDIVTIALPKRAPLVVDMVALPIEPPPQQQPQPEPKLEIEQPKVKQPVIVAPPPLVQMATPPSPVAAAPAPPPQRAAVVEAPSEPRAAPGPVRVDDLSATMISAKPPKYPIESRRRREQGIVVLNVLVGTSGSVSEISVAKSSGHPRLDKAALEAVRRWRWSPPLREGRPVLIRGYVDIPFILEG